MIKMTKWIGVLTLALLSLGLSSGTQAEETPYVTIGTGGVTGVYYPTGGSICRMVNRGRSDHGIRCGVESTQGSIYNLTKVRSGDLQLGLVQSDAQDSALKGSDEFKTVGPDKELRSVFSLHSEPFTVVARKDANINSLAELKGKRVNLGNPGSGHRALMESLLTAMGWTHSDFTKVSELGSDEQAKALCEGKFDAMVYSGGHPSGTIKEATIACDSVLLNIEGPEVEQMLAEHPLMSPLTIPAGMYRGNDNETITFGVRATLVTSAQIPDEVIYQIVKAVFGNLETFTQLHPAFNNLKPEQMVKEGLSAPLHPGALRYFQEAKLLP